MLITHLQRAPQTARARPVDSVAEVAEFCFAKHANAVGLKCCAGHVCDPIKAPRANRSRTNPRRLRVPSTPTHTHLANNRNSPCDCGAQLASAFGAPSACETCAEKPTSLVPFRTYPSDNEVVVWLHTKASRESLG